MQRGNVRLSDPADVTRKSKFEKGFRNELLVSLKNVGQGNEVWLFFNTLATFPWHNVIRIS